MDHVPRELTSDQKQALKSLSRLVLAQIELRRSVSDQSLAIRERRRAEEELDQLFTLSLDMLCIAGFDGYFKRINPAWEGTLGIPKEELLSRPYVDFVHPDDREATIREARKTDQGELTQFHSKIVIARPDGTYLWLLWKCDSEQKPETDFCGGARHHPAQTNRTPSRYGLCGNKPSRGRRISGTDRPANSESNLRGLGMGIGEYLECGRQRRRASLSGYLAFAASAVSSVCQCHATNDVQTGRRLARSSLGLGATCMDSRRAE